MKAAGDGRGFRAGVSAIAVCGLAIATSAIPLVVDAPAANAAATQCGQVLIGGSSWLSGHGVPVYANSPAGSNSLCGFYQCVELANRLYFTKGWGTVWAGNNGGAQYIPEGSPGLVFHSNSSGYHPVAGDLVIESGGVYGHVAVVNQLTGTTIQAVEQNASASGFHTYGWDGRMATGAYSGRAVRGFMHSPANTSGTGSPDLGFVGTTAPTQTAPKPTPQPLTSRAHKPSAPKHVYGIPKPERIALHWSPGAANGAPIVEYRLAVRMRIGRHRWGAWTVLAVGPTTRLAVKRDLVGGRTYQLRVRAANIVGVGPWAYARNVAAGKIN